VLYNVALANIAENGSGIRYFTNLNHVKANPSYIATCCEGQGTRLLGSLPEYLFSGSAQGLYVDMYADSTTAFQFGGAVINVSISTDFPYGDSVSVSVVPSQSVTFELSLRMPSWVLAESVPLYVNGVLQNARGTPGSYYKIVLSFPSTVATNISFSLPMSFVASKYIGVNQVTGHQRFAYEYGPILMAAMGPINPAMDTVQITGVDATSPSTWLTQDGSNNTLHFSVSGNPNVKFIPYFEIQDSSTFSVYPVVDA